MYIHISCACNTFYVYVYANENVEHFWQYKIKEKRRPNLSKQQVKRRTKRNKNEKN